MLAAIGWAESSGLSCEDEDLPYLREDEYLILARVCIAQGRNDPARPEGKDVFHLLDRLLRDAEAKARINSVLAQPEGYFRLFADEGTPMRDLLRHAQKRGINTDHVSTLLSAFGEKQTTISPTTLRPDPLAERLTEREREVLRLLLEGASNREIAQRLVLSVNTVKRHVYNLCGKLDVQSSTQAIVRARTLNLM